MWDVQRSFMEKREGGGLFIAFLLFKANLERIEIDNVSSCHYCMNVWRSDFIAWMTPPLACSTFLSSYLSSS